MPLSRSPRWPIAALLALAALGVFFAVRSGGAGGGDEVAHVAASPVSGSGAASAASATAAPSVASATAVPSASVASGPSSSAGGGEPAPGEDKQDFATVFRVPIDGSPRRGAAEPLVTIVEFADFQCPYARALEESLRHLVELSPEDVALVWKDHIRDTHPLAEPAARLARLARTEQGEPGFWRAHDIFFPACTDNDREKLVRAGIQLGLPPAKVTAAVDGKTPDAVERDCALALSLGDFGTPTVFVNGRRIVGKLPDRISATVREELAKAKKLVDSGVPRATLYEQIQKRARSGTPWERHSIEIPPTGPVLAGAHAVVDVHALGDETDPLMGLEQPVVDYLLREYGEQIRLYWHWLPDRSDPASARIAALSQAVYGEGESAVFWRFHHLLLDNQPWPFWSPPSRRARGFGDDALVDYARQAGASPLYVVDRIKRAPQVRPAEDWEAALDPDHRSGLYAGGYWFGRSRRAAKKIMDELLSGRKKER